MKKKKKKGAFGWFQTMTPGNPEYNAKMFNHLMGQGDMPTEADMNANIMGGEAVGESLLEGNENLKKVEPKDYWHIFKVVQNATNQGIPIVLKNNNKIEPIYTSNRSSDRVLYKNEWFDRNSIIDIILRAINEGSNLFVDWTTDNTYVDSSTGKLVKNESLTEAQKQNEYQITWLDFKDRKYFSHIKAYSEKQAAYMFRKNKGRGVVAKILSIDCIDDHSKDDGEQLSIFGEQMKFKVKKDLLESGTVSRRKEEFIDLWNSKFGRSEFEINSSEIQQHHIDRDTTNNPRDFSNCAYLYSKNPDHLRKAHNYIHAKNLVYNYNLNDVYILSPKGQIIKATKEILDIYALKLPNGFETSDNIAED